MTEFLQHLVLGTAPRRADLIEDVDAIPILLDRPGDSSHLALDPLEPVAAI